MPTPKTKTPVPVAPENPGDAALAYQQIEPEMAALPDAELLVIRIHIPFAVSTALGAASAIRAHRAEIVKKLPHHRIDLLDRLERYALGAWYAHLAMVASSEDRVKALVEEASTLRESLLVAADALAHFGLLDAARVAEIRVGQGYLDTADDLVALAALFTLAWPAVSGKTAIEKAQVDRAAMLGPELLTALGAREHSGAVAEKSAESRARAFTLFVRAYDACRQALTYVRWEEGDANSIAPSLFRLRKARKGKKGEVTEEKTPEEVSPPQEE